MIINTNRSTQKKSSILEVPIKSAVNIQLDKKDELSDTTVKSGSKECKPA